MILLGYERYVVGLLELCWGNVMILEILCLCANVNHDESFNALVSYVRNELNALTIIL